MSDRDALLPAARRGGGLRPRDRRRGGGDGLGGGDGELAGRLKVRLRVAGGQVSSAWYLAPWVRQRNGVTAAHLRLNGADFTPPIELGSEILVDLVMDEEGEP